MLDQLFTPDTDARRVAEWVLERAATGRRPTVAQIRAATGAPRAVVLEVQRRLVRARLIAPRGTSKRPDDA